MTRGIAFQDEYEEMYNSAEAICAVAYLHGDFQLRSGARSDYYFDKYQFESDPVLLARIADNLVTLLPEGLDLLGGLELGGVPIATALSLRTGLPQLLVRKAAKEYGTEKLAEGPDFNGKTVVLVEDVVSSGGQVAETARRLRSQGAKVDVALCVIDRGGGGEELLGELGIELRPLFTISDLAEWLPSGTGGAV